jgi:glycosyltransferase involved in cell wall biosynthesis
MIHVGIDATSWTNNRGFGRFTRELVKALASRSAGFRYTLLFDQETPVDVPNGIDAINARTTRTLSESAVGTTSRSFAYLWNVSRLARRTKFDVFFFPSVYSYFPILTRVPCVVCYHDTTAERFPALVFPTRWNQRLWQLKTALARFQTTRAMTVSEASARDLQEMFHIPKRRIDVITEGADPIFRLIHDSAGSAKVRARLGISQDAELLVYVGGINPHKNLMGLLKALPEIVAERSKVQLAIVGDTSGKGFWDNVAELKSVIDGNGLLGRHVHFTGYMPDSDLAEFLNGAAALVFPSLWEGFGLPAVEAMSCGLPVLASRRASLPEVIGDAGLFFDPEDPSDIASCTLQYLRDPALRIRLQKTALERVRRFTWDRAAELANLSFQRCYQDAGRSMRTT